MRKFILLALVVGIIAAGWFLYFNEGETATIISVYTVEKKDLENVLEFSGEVKPGSTYRAMSATGGVVKSVFVNEGDRVVAGDPLIALDTAEIDAQIQKAELSLALLQDAAAQTVMAGSDSAQLAANALAEEKIKIALALSQTTGFDYESLNEAFGEDIAEQAAATVASMGDMSMDDIADALPDDLDFGTGEISENQIAMAQLALDTLQSARSRMTMTSQISGTVITLAVSRGEVLAPGLPAMIVADTDNTTIEAYVYEKDVDALALDMDVAVITDDGRSIGTLTEIGKAASGVSDEQLPGTMTTLSVQPGAAFSRMPGAVVDLEIVLSAKQDCLALPHNCVMKDGFAFVVDEEGYVHRRAVETGFEDASGVEIISGLSEGEIVALMPKDLTEGQRVEYDRSE